jgi:hypothetical protein
MTELLSNSTYGWLVAAALIALLVVAGYMLIRLVATQVSAASSLPAPAALVLSLAMLGLMSIFAGLFTEKEPAWAIAATCVGALAASLQSFFNDRDDDHHGGGNG